MFRRMPSSARLHHPSVVRTYDSKERIAYIIRVKKIGDLGTALAVASISSLIHVTLMMEEIRSSEMSVLTRATRCNIPEGSILHNHRCENLKSYITLTGWTL
jgi:hypothetical protein